MSGARSPIIEELNINLMSRAHHDLKKPGVRVRCFICHCEVDREMVAFVNHSLEEVACVCRKHLEGPEKETDC